MKNSEKFLRKTLAMSFKFSLLDDDFAIHVNGTRVGVRDLQDLANATQFLWLINDYDEAYIQSIQKLKHEAIGVTEALPIKGFLATVFKPRDAKIDGTEERASVDLFVNGRLREKNILRHIPTQRIIESYLYGQIHFDYMDRGEGDPFTSSREGVLEDDEAFKKLLNFLKRDMLPKMLDEWDEMRLAVNDEGDDENKRASKKDRKAKAFISEAEKEYSPGRGTPQKKIVDKWLKDLRPDAQYNISAYVDCFLTENLLRKFVVNQAFELDKECLAEIKKFRDGEERNLTIANISQDITQQDTDLNYLGMDNLCQLSEGGKNDKKTGKLTPLCMDGADYKPIRNAVGHTSLLTGFAKRRLNNTLDNIKGRLSKLLKNANPS